MKKLFIQVEAFTIWTQLKFWGLRLYIRNSPRLIEYMAYAFVVLSTIFITIYLLIALANTPPVRIR